MAHRAEALGKKLGARVVVDEHDIENGEQYGLACDTRWLDRMGRILRRHCDAALLPPPCSTCSAAWHIEAEGHARGGPGHLRDAEGPGCCGRSDLKSEEKEKVRYGTLMAIRAAQPPTSAT